MKPEEVLSSNLSLENKIVPAFLEKRAAHIANAVHLLLPLRLPNSEERLGILADVGRDFLRLLEDTYPDSDGILPFHRSELLSLSRSLLEGDAAMFARRVALSLFQEGIDLLDESDAFDGEISVAYVRNKLSDEAFRRILAIRHVKPIYVDSFKVAAEMVSNGDADACLLPTETGSGYRIRAALDLADEYRLRIYGVENLPDGEGEARLLLLSGKAIAKKQPPKYMTLRFLPSDAFSLASILSAAEHYGLKVYRFYTDIESSGRQSMLMTLSFEKKAEPTAFFAYMCLFSASLQFYGVY